MNTFWLKIVGIAVAAVVVIIIINAISSRPKPQPAPPEQGFSDQVRKDKEKFLSRPSPVDSNSQSVPMPPRKDANQPVTTVVQPPKQTETITLYFVPLSEIDDIEAERLLNVSVPGRSIGRLPMTGFKLMVDNCRMTISRWPESWYAYRAKQMLADMPQRFWPRYKVTKEEIDVSMYKQPRPGTKAFTFEEPR